jgi:hypothetical protein
MHCSSVGPPHDGQLKVKAKTSPESEGASVILSKESSRCRKSHVAEADRECMRRAQRVSLMILG